MSDIVKEYSPINCLHRYGEQTNARARLMSGAPTIRQMGQKYGAPVIVEIVANHLTSLNDFLNIKSKMTKSQIEETAYIFCRQYYFLNMSEVTNIIADIKTGKFGKLFESLDGQKIFSFVSEYIESRSTAYQQLEKEQEQLAYKRRLIDQEHERKENKVMTLKEAAELGVVPMEFYERMQALNQDKDKQIKRGIRRILRNEENQP